jgi:hypothetical protein
MVEAPERLRSHLLSQTKNFIPPIEGYIEERSGLLQVKSTRRLMPEVLPVLTAPPPYLTMTRSVNVPEGEMQDNGVGPITLWKAEGVLADKIDE